MNEQHYLIPSHSEGAATDIVHSLSANNIDDADSLFLDAKDRLMNVAKWDKYAGIDNVHFVLADGHGHAVHRRTHRGDHIIIAANSAAGQNGEKYDWLTIDALEYDDYPDENYETFAIRLHITAAGDNTSATIVIGRRGKLVSATYHGRNNATSEPGIWHGLGDAQWAALMKGLLESYEV